MANLSLAIAKGRLNSLTPQAPTMPTLMILLLVVSVSYQMFFRFDHWVDPHHPEVVYERDNLTGLMHQFDPTKKISMINRITGHYPETMTVTNSAPVHGATTTHHPEAVTAMAVTTQPVPHHNHVPQAHATGAMNLLMTDTTPAASALKRLPTAPPKAVTQPKPVAQTVIAAPTPKAATNNPSVPHSHSPSSPFSYTEQGADFNRDGNAEKITLARSGSGNTSQTEITILEGQREIFYGKGQRLQMLSTRRNGWNDIALITPSGKQRLFGYDTLSQGYEPLPSNGTAITHR